MHHNIEQNTDEWFELRIGKITGSNFNNIMKSAKQRELPFNKTQLTYLYSVCAEMFTGVDEDDFMEVQACLDQNK